MFSRVNNYVFSDPEGFRSKAQCEGNGYSFCERWNATAGILRAARRVNLSKLTDCFVPAGKEIATACEVRLAVNIDKLTELTIISRREH